MKFLVKTFLNMNTPIKEKLCGSFKNAILLASLMSIDDDCQSIIIDIDTGEVLKKFF